MEGICFFIFMMYVLYLFLWGMIFDGHNIGDGYGWTGWSIGLAVHIISFILLKFCPGESAIVLVAASAGLGCIASAKSYLFLTVRDERFSVSISTVVFTGFLNLILLMFVTDYTYLIWTFGTLAYIISLAAGISYEWKRFENPDMFMKKGIKETEISSLQGTDNTSKKAPQKKNERNWSFWPFNSRKAGFETVTESSGGGNKLLTNPVLSQYEAEMLNILGIPGTELDHNTLERAYRYAKNTYDPTAKGGKEILKIIDMAYEYLRKVRN